MACNNSNKISDLILFLTGNPRACRVQVVHKGGTHMATATMSRIDELRDLQGRARHIDVRNETAFQEILRDARSVLEMSESQIADALSISRPTFNRWINGRSMPHIAMRTPVISWISEQLNSRIRSRSAS